MFIGRAFLADEGELLVLGLSHENVSRLVAGQPIDISRKSHGMSMPENLRICIFVGKDETEMEKMMQPLVGPETIIGAKRPT